MDGTFAVLFLIAGLADMGISHCGNGCLAPSDTDTRLSISAGEVIFQEEGIGAEIYARYDFGREFGPFQPVVGVSATDSGDLWAGAGLAWTEEFNRLYTSLHLMPGLYAQGSGPDLGGVFEIRSGIEIGLVADNGIRYGLSYDHRSNAETYSSNPGLETFQFRVSIPLR